MKSKLLFLLVAVLFFIQSCKKEIISNPIEVVNPRNKIIEQARFFLSSNYTRGPLTDLSINASVIHKLNKGQFVIRIPFNSDGGKNFILLAADSISGIKMGKVFNIAPSSNILKQEKFNGTITIKDLSGKLIQVRNVINGFNISKRTSVSTLNNTKRSSDDPTNPDCPDCLILPDIIISVPATIDIFSNETQYSEWVNMGLLYNDINYENWYMFDPINSNTSYSPDPNTFEAFYEDASDKTKANLNKYFNCFTNIPDAGATCTIKICVDLPDINNPNKLEVGGHPGHAFIILNKTNGGQSVTQTIGFYPANGPLSASFQAVNGEMVDNEIHRYYASISANVNPIDFKAALDFAKYLANNSIKYDLNDFNCTDFALQTFNQSVSLSNQLAIPDHIEYGINFGRTPNELYKKLQSMQSLDPTHVNVNNNSDIAPLSHGECN